MKQVQAKGVNLPKFRYLDDVMRFLDNMGKELRDTEQLVRQQQKLLASLKDKKASIAYSVQPLVKAAFSLKITPTTRQEQLKEIRKMKGKIDPSLTKVKVPNLDKLKSQYALAEDLHEKYTTLEAMEAQLNIQFPERNKGEAFKKALDSINALKTKVQTQLKTVFGYLNEVASNHVPDAFAQYMNSIVELVKSHVIFGSSDLFLYVSVADDGALVFTYYLMLKDVVNEEGFVTPHLYISVQWKLGTGDQNRVTVQLNHEYDVPNKLLSSGMTVTSVGDAVKAISQLLELENFNSALGVVPLILQLKVDPSAIDISQFSWRDFVSSMTIDPDTDEWTFVLRPEVNDRKTIDNIKAAFYTDLKGFFKDRTKFSIKEEKAGKAIALVVKTQKVSQKGEFNARDAEFLRERFGLNDAALKKVVNILNQNRG